MGSRRKLIPAGLALVAIGAAAALAGLSRGSGAALPEGLPGFASYQPIPTCIEEIGEPLTEPEYAPATLPLPIDSFVIRTPEDPAPGLHIIVYAVPVNMDNFVTFVQSRWPDSGWELGRGERERGEAESVFFLPDKSRYGQFRAREVFCDLNMLEVTLILGEPTPDKQSSKSP